MGAFFLVRRGNDVCAVRLLGAQTSDEVEYEAFYRADGSADFAAQNVTLTSGTVFENYKREMKDAVHEVTNLGGEHFIRCGPFEIEWSMGNWIYTWGDFEIASTGRSDFYEIDIHQVGLEWHDGGE